MHRIPGEFLIAFLLFLSFDCIHAHEKQRCMSMVTSDFANCDNLIDGDSSSLECPQVDVCRKQFKFTCVELEPFNHILENIVVSAIGMCCGHIRKCRNGSYYENTTIALKSLNQADLSASNFIFPILGHQSTTTIFGYHFIPLLQLSKGYLVTKATTSREVLNRLIISCANLWPLLVIVILLSVIAGFIIWIPETWFNKDEFPRMFFRGLFEGFWWAFVSMTTVGYGDKCPKFVLSRLWSIIWILVGITICSIFTASLTNEITSASNAPDPSMHGKTIGVFKYRSFDAAFVAKQGGRIKETKGISEDENVREIKNMLSSGEVDGIFMDKFTYMHAVSFAKNAQEQEHSGGHHHESTPESEAAAEFFLKETVHTTVSFEGQKMAYGILVREEEDYEYFEEFLNHNQIVYETCALLHLNEDDIRSEKLHDIFSADDHNAPFFDFLYVCLGIIFGILVIGSLFEIARRSNVVKQIENAS